MNILSTLFIMVFYITQVKNENILLDSSDCQTKCPIRRQTIRSYPPGTLLFVGDECVCGGAQETIYEYVPAVQPVENLALPVGFKPKEIEPLSNNRLMGNYGSLVFSANVQILDLLRIKNDDVCIGCYDRDQKQKNPSSHARIISTTKKPTAEVNTPMTMPALNNVSSMKSETSTKQYTSEEDIEKYTNVSIFTEPILGNTMTTTVKESTPESYVTNDSSEILTSTDIAEIQTSTVKPKHKEVFTTEENNVILEKNNTLNESNSKEKPNLSDQFKVMIINSFSNNKSDDLEILLINTDTFNFNN
ncbi:uncharacterized protein LOC114122296 isoform X2 [Aphis gossypii]|uniref:uncharacterized protein LOC114122296 isoform X2 n=1 Tax=Aphis gossypii TaxID=80765 RepID=UPI002158B6B9|nr:uncharacterized protein LOC114122296 isoform X2 [Aphis gossypii]